MKYGQGTVGTQLAFGATYRDVNCYSAFTSRSSSIRNHFQVVLIDRSDIATGDFDIEFNYDQIIWETGEASDGSTDCLGGSPARVGFSDGDTNAFELAGSGVIGAFLDSGPAATSLINNSLNSGGHLGRYIFEVRDGTPTVPGNGNVTCTKGFWKNHVGAWDNLVPDDDTAPWTGTSTYLEVLNTPPKKGDASIILGHAFIAATLNTGADAGDLTAAENMLIAHPVGSNDLKAGKHADSDRAVALGMAEALQEFNESGECSLSSNDE